MVKAKKMGKAFQWLPCPLKTIKHEFCISSIKQELSDNLAIREKILSKNSMIWSNFENLFWNIFLDMWTFRILNKSRCRFKELFFISNFFPSNWVWPNTGHVAHSFESHYQCHPYYLQKQGMVKKELFGWIWKVKN